MLGGVTRMTSASLLLSYPLKFQAADVLLHLPSLSRCYPLRGAIFP